MDIEKFANLSYRQLEKITNIDKSNWSKYFNNKLSPRWKTINDAAKSLDMKPSDLMIAIEKRRQKTLKKMYSLVVKKHNYCYF